MYKPDEEEVVQAEEVIETADAADTALPEDPAPDEAEEQLIEEEE